MLRIMTAVLIAISFAAPAAAETKCGDRGDILKHLSRNYKEAPVAMGLVSNGNVLEVLSSGNGSWTIIITRPDGKSCVMAVGEAWDKVPTLVAGPIA